MNPLHRSACSDAFLEQSTAQIGFALLHVCKSFSSSVDWMSIISSWERGTMRMYKLWVIIDCQEVMWRLNFGLESSSGRSGGERQICSGLICGGL